MATTIRILGERPDRSPRPPAPSQQRGEVPTRCATIGSGDSPSGGPGTLDWLGWEPAIVPGYEIECALGRGGMGVVYKARQIGLNRTVALKMVSPARLDDPRKRVRFLAEAEAVAAVRHPNVVQVYEFGQTDGRPYLAMEFLNGGTLSDRIRQHGRLDPREAAEVVEKVAQGVEAAHLQGVVHRDLKSANILFASAECGARNAELKTQAPGSDSGGSHSALRTSHSALQPKVTDFGIAKRGGIDLTVTGAVLGTPAYMAPEQAKGEGKFAGPAADIYALGVILYECLTGRPPFTGVDTWEVLRRVATETPEPVHTRASGVPRDLELICLKCLRKEPRDRYPSAAALSDDLRRYLEGKPITARPLGPLTRFFRLCQRNQAVAALTATSAALLVAGAVTSTVYAVRAARALEAAEKANQAREEETRRQKQLVRDFLRFLASRQDLTDAQQRQLVAEFLREHPELDADDFRRALKDNPLPQKLLSGATESGGQPIPSFNIAFDGD